MRVLSGIQPTGKIHLGNYFSMLLPMLRMQNSCELFCFIADYHSLSTIRDREVLEENIFDLATSLLSLGINPQQTCFWRQSDVPEIIEFSWILSSHITIPQLQLAHSYKDKIQQNIKPSLALFAYPVLMAADILAFQTQKVPVGKDQKQHIEICRDIAMRFNDCYSSKHLVLPQEEILENIALVPGIDGRKMSKSYNNTIEIFAPEKVLRKAIMRIVTDSTGVDEVKNIENSTLYEIYHLFTNVNVDKGVQESELKKKFIEPGTGYGHIKQELYECILDYFKDAREKKEELMGNPEKVKEILSEGAVRAKKIVQQNICTMKEIVGLA